MKKKYQAWEASDKGSSCLVPKKCVDKLKSNGTIEKNASLLHEIAADTWEEAMAVYHVKMGWEPYTPYGEPHECPHCGSIFYPQESSECPLCGIVV